MFKTMNCFHFTSNEYRVQCFCGLWILPLICIIGIPINISYFLINGWLAAKNCNGIQRTQGIGAYLTALVTYDLFLLFALIFLVTLPDYFQLSHYYPEMTPLEDNDAIFAHFILFSFPIAMTANYASVWTVVVICIKRYLAVCHPLQKRRLNNDKLIVVIIFVLSAAFNISRYFEYVPIKHLYRPNATYIFLGPQLRNNYLYKMLNDAVVYGLFVYILPLCVLVALNGKILWTLFRRKKLLRKISRYRKRFHKKEEQGSLLICAIIITFFICHTLAFVLRWLEAGIPPTAGSPPEFKTIFAVSNLLVALNSAINPLFYFLLTKTSRQAIKALQNELMCVKEKYLQTSSTKLPTDSGNRRKRSFSMDALSVPNRAGFDLSSLKHKLSMKHSHSQGEAEVIHLAAIVHMANSSLTHEATAV